MLCPFLSVLRSTYSLFRVYMLAPQASELRYFYCNEYQLVTSKPVAMRRARAAEPEPAPNGVDAKRMKTCVASDAPAPLTPRTPAPRTPRHDGDRLFNSPPPTSSSSPRAAIRSGADGVANDRALDSDAPVATPIGFTRRFFATALSRAFGSNLKTPPRASETEQKAVSEASALRETLREERIRVEELHVRVSEAEAALCVANKTLDGLRERVVRAEDEAKAAKASAAAQASPSVTSVLPQTESSLVATRLIASYFASRRCDSCGLDELLASALEANVHAEDVLRALARLVVDTPSRSSSFMVTIHQI